jgi:hypothetical protein
MKPSATPDQAPRFSRDLLWYTAAAGAVVGLTSNTAEAQIVYTDLDPDEFVSDGSFLIDFDGDGDPEIEINEDDVDNDGNPRDYTRAYKEPVIGPDSTTGIIADLIEYPGGGLYAYPRPLAAGVTVDGGGDFQDYYLFTFTFLNTDPVTWLGEGERYIGVRLSMNEGGTATTHFGWVLLEMPVQGGSILVKSFAYEATPNTPIQTGDTGVGIAPGPDGRPGTHALSAAHPNPFRGEARLTLEVAETQAVRVVVYDVVGREVALLHDGTMVQGHPHVLALDGAGLPDGVYMVRTVGATFTDARPVTLRR